MFFPFMDHKTVDTTFPGSNQNDNKVLIYTTEYPCVLFYEPLSTPGCFSGYGIWCEFTNSRGRVERKDIYGEAGGAFESLSTFTYIHLSGAGVYRQGADDDCGGSGRLHILRLPQDMGRS